jgi:ABC-type branched-subunit amino acid transport system ATPase component
MTVIEVRGLVKRFGPATVVDGLSFAVGAGTVTGFLGPNGAGKPNLGIRHFFSGLPNTHAVDVEASVAIAC